MTDCTGAQWWIGPPGEPQDHHPVWYVYDGMPLRYRVQCDTLIPWTLCALWVDAFGVAADTWNDALTQSGSTRRIITSRSTCPLSDTVKIKIYSRRALPAPLVEYDLQGRRIEHYGNTHYGIHKDMKDYCQNDIFYIRELNIAINGDNPYDDDASDEMTSREWEFPTPSGLYMQPDPKMHLAAHELGHVLGLSEGGGWPIGPEGAPPPPGTPHPPPSGVHMSVNPMIINTLATGYHETPIDPVISPGDRDTAKCLFFR